MISLHKLQTSNVRADDRPFDVGYESGLSGQSLFDCPYGHVTEQALRQRHEWLEGYLTALAHKGAPGLY